MIEYVAMRLAEDPSTSFARRPNETPSCWPVKPPVVATDSEPAPARGRARLVSSAMSCGDPRDAPRRHPPARGHRAS